MKVKTAPDNNNKGNIQDSIEKLNKNIENLIAQKEKEKSKTNSGDKTDSSSSYEEKLQKLQDKKEDKYREENRKLRDSLGDSLLPKDIRNPGINALAGGLLGIDPAVMQAFGVDKAVGSLFNNLKSKRRTNQDIKIESQRLNRRYESVDKTTKKQYGSVIQEDEDTKYAKHFNELNKTLKEGFSNKKEQQEEKKEKSSFFSKVLGFLFGPAMKFLAGIAGGMLLIRGINLLLNNIYDAIADTKLGRLLGLKSRKDNNNNTFSGTGRDENGRKNGLSQMDVALDIGVGATRGLNKGGLRLIERGDAVKNELSLNSRTKGLSPQQKVSYVAKHPEEYALSAEAMKKAGLYENKGVYGWLKNAAKENPKATRLGKVKEWLAKQGLKAYPATTKATGTVLKYGSKIGKRLPFIDALAGTYEAGTAYMEGDNRTGNAAVAGTVGGLATGALVGGAAVASGAGALAILGAYVLGSLGGDWGSRKISNLIYDINHPQSQDTLQLDGLNTDQSLSRTNVLEEAQRSLEQMKFTHDFQRNSMESLENIEKILKENQYQDKAYYTEDLRKNFWTSISGNNETPNESEFGNMTQQMETYSDLVFKV